MILGQLMKGNNLSWVFCVLKRVTTYKNNMHSIKKLMSYFHWIKMLLIGLQSFLFSEHLLKDKDLGINHFLKIAKRDQSRWNRKYI